MIDELKVQRDIIALEAFTLSNPSQLLSGFFPSIGKKLKDLALKFKADEPAIRLDSRQKDFLKRLEKLNYLDIRGLTLVDHTGINTSLANFSGIISSLASQLKNIQKEVLNPFSTYTASLISRDDHKFDTTNYFTTFQKYASGIEKDFTQLNSFVNPRVGTDRTIGDLIDRNKDWLDIFKYLNDAQRDLNSVDRNAMQNKVKEISSYIDLIIEKVKSKELEDVSPEVVRTLAEGAYQCAHLLELYSINYFYLLAVSTIVNDTMSKIMDIKM